MSLLGHLTVLGVADVDRGHGVLRETKLEQRAIVNINALLEEFPVTSHFITPKENIPKHLLPVLNIDNGDM